MDAAKYRQDFWRDVKKDFYVKNPNMGPRRKKFLANLIKSNSIESVLELGCCSGGNLKQMRLTCPNIKLVGFDINETAIKYAQEVEKVDAEFKVGSLYDLNCFDDKSFDLVFTCAVLVHLPSERVPEILKNMVRISKKFVFNIESQDGDKIMTISNEMPYAWFTNYCKIYKDMGLRPHSKAMESIVGSKDKIGVARDLVWCDLTEEKLKL